MVYDGGSQKSPMLGQYCGGTIPPNHISSSDKLLINFVTDEASTRTGFYIEYNPHLQESYNLDL